MGFVHLHVHSQLSLLDGTMDPAGLARAVRERGMAAVALTDSSNMFGAVAFYQACRTEGIHPILGAELFVEPRGIEHRPERDTAYHLGVLVGDAQGYRNLCALITTAIFDGTWYKPRVDLELLRTHAEGLLFFTRSLKGPLAPLLREGRAHEARARLDALVDAVGTERLFLELVDVGLEGQLELNEGVRQLAAHSGLPTVVSNAVHYADPQDAPVQEVLNCIAEATSVAATEGRTDSPTDQAYLKTEAEMREIFPDDGAAIDRTVEIAQRCRYDFDFDTYHFPATDPPDVAAEGEPQPDTDRNWAYFFRAFPPARDFEVPGGGRAGDLWEGGELLVPPRPEGGGNLDGYFRWYAHRGLDLRLGRIPASEHARYRERLELEMDIVISMGFSAYLLIVAEFINWSKDEGIPVGPGRGSAAGSLVAWAMRITDIDPLRFDLLFERFLNPERVSMPDIDVDFCQDRREEVIAHVRDKYGAPLVSQIITYNKLKAKAAVRDVARVLDLGFTDADRIAKLIPDELGIKLTDAIQQVEMLATLYDRDPRTRRLLELALRVEGAYRQTSVHAAGVVIADKPLVEYAPLFRLEAEGGPVVQYDMKSAESIGLIKFDFLGLKTLDQIRDAVEAVKENHDINIDIGEVPTDDSLTYQLLQRGDTLGVFQLESSGMRELLARLQPSVLDDLVALVALYRPGPLSSGMTDDFVERKHGRKRVEYPLPMLEPILQNTYGTIVYQEQVMQIAQEMAGYSLGEADLLRRAMGKKKKSAMDKQLTRFLSGSVANGIDEAKAREIFELLAKFAAYGFNKSHSAAYGYVSYQTAWLKAHHRAEFMAALMTSEAANTDKVLAYIRDCRSAGIPVRPVCVNRSRAAFHAVHDEEGTHVRFGLAAVKNVGGASVRAILEAREADGPFGTAFDFFARVEHGALNRRVVENLVKAGAFDCFGLGRASLLAGVEGAMATGQRHQEDKAAGQAQLFAALAPADQPHDFRFPELPDLPLSEKLSFERDTLGMFLTGHPMQSRRNDVQRLASLPLGRLDEADPGGEVRVVGLPAELRVVRTRRGDKMAFVQLEDVDATVECVFFADAWGRSQRVLESGEVLLVTGSVEHRSGELKIRVSSAEALREIRSREVSRVRFALEVEDLAGDRLDRFRTLLLSEQGPCRAELLIRQRPQLEVAMQLPFRVEPSISLEERVHALFERPDVVRLS